MAGALRKTMVYLGLAEEDNRYDGYDADDETAYEVEDERADHYYQPERATSEPADLERPDERRAAVTPISRAQVARVVSGPAPTQLHRITTIHPRTYNEAKTIGESFRSGTPVIMNLTDMDDSDAKRLVDFAAGLVFAVHGTIERVTSKVFLLSPPNVTVAAEDKQLIAEGGFFNQS